MPIDRERIKETIQGWKDDPDIAYRSNPAVRDLIDEESGRLVELAENGLQRELLDALRELHQRLEAVLSPAEAGEEPGTPDTPGTPGTPDALDTPGPPGALPNIVRSPESYADMTPEQIKEDVERQYNGRLATMRYFGIIDDTDNPEVECIDEIKRKAPTHQEIWQELSRPENSAKMEAIKTLKNPKLIITPIGMPLSTLADKVASQNGRMRKNGAVLEQKPVYRDNWDINSDVTGKMKYFPSKFEKDNHGGKTKRELLAAGSPFAGWQVVFVAGEQDVEDTNKDAPGFLKEWKNRKYDALTTEEIMMLHPEGVVDPFRDANEAHPYNREKFEWALGSYIPGMQAPCVVPDVHWFGDSQELRLNWYNPACRGDGLGPRRAVRVF